MRDRATSDLWWKNAIIYCVDVATFLDSDGDGIGDLAGLTRRLDYLADLGVTCLWLMPFHPSPLRDDGYDVTDHYGVDPRFGTLGDFVELVRTADDLGIRIMLDLVLNHTSDEHPWFRRARRERRSRFRDYYVWSDEPLAEPSTVIFPGEQRSTWSRDEEAGQWYLHRYHHFMPDLNIANPEVRDEMGKIIGFWLRLGVSGFRVDSTPFLIETIGQAGAWADPHDYLKDLRALANRRRGDAVFLGEANIEPERQWAFFGGERCEEMQMLFDFATCSVTWLSLGRGRARPLADWLRQRPRTPRFGQYAVFLRHHDELNFERLSPPEREEVFRRFAPDPADRIYGRGLRRRTAPLLGGDHRRLRMALSLLLALPGAPVLLYGEEIGLGDHPDLPGRLGVRVPMQWSERRNAGFSTAAADDLFRPVVGEGDFGYRRVNVASQLRDPDSLLGWTRRAVHVRRQCPEIGWGQVEPIDCGDERVLALLASWRGGRVLLLHNLADERGEARLTEAGLVGEDVHEMLSDDPAHPVSSLREPVVMNPYGLRWLRIVDDPGVTAAY